MSELPPEEPEKPGTRTKPVFRVVADAETAAKQAATTEQEVKDLLDAGVNDEAIRVKLAELEQEHRDLDHAIHTLEERLPYDRLTLQRMKKRKLLLKDKIFELKDKLEPDIIA